MHGKDVRIFDYPRFAEPFRDQIHNYIKRCASDSGVEIEFIRKSGVRKESVVSAVLEKRGAHPGIVHIISAMETCNTFKPWHDKSTGRNYLKPDVSKCLHYYVYFIDEHLGLGYVRMPTWLPCRLQIYINGHNVLANKLKQAGIGYTMLDNAFDSIEDPAKAQELSDAFSVEKLHRKLDELAWKYCPVYKELGLRYHWSVMQAEYATDIVFKKQSGLQPLYRQLVSTAIHTVGPDNIATFLGRKLALYQGEAGNQYNVRIEGSRIKHSMGSCSIKMYDKSGKMLRIETTSNDIGFFRHYREVVHRDGTKSNENATMKKNIYSLAPLAGIMAAANRRYLEFISTFTDNTMGRQRLEQVSSSKCENNRNYKGFNFFDKEDVAVLLAIVRGEFNISGFRNKDLQMLLGMAGSKVSRLIKRLHVLGLIKKVANTYKYYVTKIGRKTIIMAQKIKEMVIIPDYSF